MYDNLSIIIIYMYTRHLSATQALARVRVAVPRGPERHVASTWARMINAPFCNFCN